MIVTLTGNNDYARKAELMRLVAAFAAEYGDMAVERLDGEETTADRMQEALQSLPFLSPRKLVILREPSKQKAFAEQFAGVVKDLPDSTDVILYEPKLDKRSAYYKTLKKETDYQEFAELDAAALARYAVDYATRQGGKLALNDAKLLIDRVGLSQQLLTGEIDKLLAYEPVITAEMIILLTDSTPQSTVFELLDAAFSGRAERAFTLYREQRAMKVEPQAVIAMLAWQLHVLALVKAGAASHKSVDEIAKGAKLNPFVVRKSQSLIRRLTLERVKQLIGDLLHLDMQLKRSSIDADEAVQLYLLKLAHD